VAENSLLKEIIIRAKAEGINEASSALDVLKVSVDAVGASGQVQSGQMNKINKAVYGTSSAAKQASASLPTLRYALYDVSNTLAMAGAAMTGLTVATAGASITMERQFADVLRTSEAYLDSTGKSASNLQKEFKELFTSMPVSWGDLTKIGTLAGQLNIAKEDIAEFSELVAKFAATTDVSVEQSATAFGRLSQLLDVPANEFENLGSSILAVGVNSVATESQIIAISTQLASMGNFAGFSADEVFGLSSALASLGTQPELSRGVITRLFTNISTSISEGGERLDAFGRLAGTTGQGFAQAWGDDAAGALLKLMQGLGAVEDSKAVETLHELGITASRDVPTILRLAQNNEVLAESLQVAADGYRDGTALQEQYSVISSTVAEKITVLVNNLQNFIATVGQSSGALGGLIDVAIAVVKAFTGLIDNPITATILGIVGALAAVTGPLLLMGALLVRGTASMIAMKTATAEAAVAMGLYNSQAAAMSVSTARLTAQTAQAAVGMRVFGVAARSALIGTGIGIALLAIGAAWEYVAKSIDNVSGSLDKYSGYSEQFSQALKQDTATYKESGEALFTFTSRISSVSSEEKSWQQTMATTSDMLGITDDSVKRVTNSLTEQEYAFGSASLAAAKYALSQDETFQQLANNPEFRRMFELLGADMDTFVAIASEKGTNAAVAYLNGLRQELLNQNYSGEINLGFEDLNVVTYGMDQFYGKVRDVTSALFGQVEAQREVDTTMQFLGIAADDASAELDNLAASLFDIENAMLGSENAIFNLGQTLGESGGEFGYFSEEGRVGIAGLIAAMDALNKESGGVASVVVGDFVALRDALIQAGIGGGQAVDFLNAKIAELAGGKAVKSSGRDFSNLFAGWASGADRAARSTRNAGQATREAREEVRTLLDYAGDLAKVWNRAFDIRFSGQQTLDTITSSFIKIREEAEEARKRIRDLNNDISSLNSDINIQEYFLSIAIEYGDTKRAEAIEADLLKKRAELADKTADLQKEQDAASKSLVGNSKGAIENRRKITDLVSQYQAHIQALAASGMSQADLAQATARLKADFMAQATQLGYNQGQLQLYAAAFDDVSYAIGNVPRDITVSAHVNPAIQAMREFEAQVKKSMDSARGAAGNPISPSFNTANATPAGTNAGNQFSEAFNAAMRRRIANIKMRSDRGDWQDGIQIMGGFASGGYTGTGGKYEPAGIVHKGEYVIPKHMVNQSTGLPYADALGRLSKGVSTGNSYANGGFVRQSSAASVVTLSPASIQALAQATGKNLILNGQIIAQTTSDQYAYDNSIGAN